MDITFTGFALATAILPWVFFGFVACSLENTIEDLENEVENLSESVERLSDAVRNKDR